MAEASLGPSKRSSKEASREGGPKRGRTVGRTDTQRPSQSWGPGYFLKPQVLALKSGSQTNAKGCQVVASGHKSNVLLGRTEPQKGN